MTDRKKLFLGGLGALAVVFVLGPLVRDRGGAELGARPGPPGSSPLTSNRDEAAPHRRLSYPSVAAPSSVVGAPDDPEVVRVFTDPHPRLSDLYRARAIETCACSTLECAGHLADRYLDRLSDPDVIRDDEDKVDVQRRRMIDCLNQLSASSAGPPERTPASRELERGLARALAAEQERGVRQR